MSIVQPVCFAKFDPYQSSVQGPGSPRKMNPQIPERRLLKGVVG